MQMFCEISGEIATILWLIRLHVARFTIDTLNFNRTININLMRSSAVFFIH